MTQPTPSTTPTATWRSKVAKGVAAVAAIGALALGANAITSSDSSTTAAATGAENTAAGAPGAAGAPTGAPPRMGTAVTGDTLTKVTDAATAKYPGDVERAMQLADGSYEVHVVQSNGDGEVRVLVSKAFEVTGLRQGGPPAGAPPADRSAPSGATTSSAS